MSKDDNICDTSAIEDVLQSVVKRHRRELLELTEEELKKRWYFQWEKEYGIEWNLYKFSDMLEMHKRDCRDWETHYHGYMLVVERVRDKYIMPRIREFLAELKQYNKE